MKRRKRKARGRKPTTIPDGDATYVCPTCGEQIVVPVDRSQGDTQKYGEDCPVCCHPNVIYVEFDDAWDEPRVWAEAE
jgi:predicted RNA-binding Zn-ribbon protein involved in translation (DUF1610 family)